MWPNPRIWSHLLKKSLMEIFIFCAVTSYNKDEEDYSEQFLYNFHFETIISENLAATLGCKQEY